MGCGASKDPEVANTAKAKEDEEKYKGAEPSAADAKLEENKEAKEAQGSPLTESAAQLEEDAKVVAKDGEQVKQEKAERKEGNHLDVINHYKEKKKGKSNIIFTHSNIEVYKEESGFEHIELSRIYEHLAGYMKENKLDKLDSAAFIKQCQAYNLFVNQKEMGLRLFSVMDSSRDGFLDLGELVTGLSIFARGTKTEKIKVCFDAYDVDGDGGVTKEEMGNLLKSYISASLKSVSAAIEFEIIEAEAFGDPVGRLSGEGEGYAIKEDAEGKEEQLTIETPIGPITMNLNKKDVTDDEKDPYVRMHGDEFLHKMIDEIFAKYDRSHDGVIQVDEFLSFVRGHKALLEWFEYLE